MNLESAAAKLVRHHLRSSTRHGPSLPGSIRSAVCASFSDGSTPRGMPTYDAIGEDISVRYGVPSALLVSVFVFPVSGAYEAATRNPSRSL